MLGKAKEPNSPNSQQSESAMFTKRHYSQNGDSRTGNKNGRPWFDHCRRVGHTKDTYWEIHGKPPHLKQSDLSWRQKRQGENRGFSAAVEEEKGTEKSQSGLGFSKEQLEQLKAILNGPSSTSVQPTASVAQKDNYSFALTAKTKISHSWVIDSGASYHMTSHLNQFLTYSPCTSPIKIKIVVELLPRWPELDLLNFHQL